MLARKAPVSEDSGDGKGQEAQGCLKGKDSCLRHGQASCMACLQAVSARDGPAARVYAGFEGRPASQFLAQIAVSGLCLFPENLVSYHHTRQAQAG